MKKCIVISDSFKGTLSSLEICDIARQSVPRFFPECQVVTVPVADGGEGTVECFVEAIQAQPVTVEVSGPYGEKIQATYARSGSRAVVEMACAAGLPMVGERRNPEATTTYGVGEVIRHAVEHGCDQILLGLGGLGRFAGRVDFVGHFDIPLSCSSSAWPYYLYSATARGRLCRGQRPMGKICHTALLYTFPSLPSSEGGVGRKKARTPRENAFLFGENMYNRN